jgi:hypothetical protein
MIRTNGFTINDLWPVHSLQPRRVGDMVKKRQCLNRYRLPEGLPEGAKVKVVGARDIEFEGRRFRMAMPCVNDGLEYWVEGKWKEHSGLLKQ